MRVFDRQNFLCTISLFLTIFLFFPSFSNGETKKYHMKVYYKEGAPDGVEGRKILTANGNFPGELIECKEGDTLIIWVTNAIEGGNETDNVLAMHWHGIFQDKGSQFNDGAEFVTQCTIPVGKTMKYEFTVHQTGTYWYHAHTAVQYTEGLYGPIVIRPRGHKSSSYSEEDYGDSDVEPEDQIILMLSDWNHLPGAEIAAWVLSPGGGEPIPDSCLLNGRGRYPCDVAESQTPSLSCSESAQILPRFYATRGKTYKIRVICASALTSFDFTIDKHLLEVVELDGNLVRRQNKGNRKKYSDEYSGEDHHNGDDDSDPDKNPNLVNVFTIHPAQRVSVLVKMENEDDDGEDLDLFWIRAKVLKSLFFNGNVSSPVNQNPEALKGQVLGVLEYENGDKMQQRIESSYQFQSIFDPVPFPLDAPLPQTKSIFKLNKEDSEKNKIWRLNDLKLSYLGGPAPLPRIKRKKDSRKSYRWDYRSYGNYRKRGSYDNDRESDYLSRKYEQEPIFQVNLQIGFVASPVTGAGGFAFNGIVYTPDHEDKPLLAKILNKETIPATVNPFHIPHGSVVQLVINNPGGGSHTLHKHGGFFWVVGAGKPNDGNFKGSVTQLNLDGPPRDSVFIEAKSWLVLQYLSDNPGAWLFHCHIQWHALGGLSMVLIEGEKELRDRFDHVPKEAKKVCGFDGIDI